MLKQRGCTVTSLEAINIWRGHQSRGGMIGFSKCVLHRSARRYLCRENADELVPCSMCAFNFDFDAFDDEFVW